MRGGSAVTEIPWSRRRNRGRRRNRLLRRLRVADAPNIRAPTIADGGGESSAALPPEVKSLEMRMILALSGG